MYLEQFEDENKAPLLYARLQSSNELPPLVQWLLSRGIAKTPQKAIGLLVVVIIVAIVISVIILYRTNARSAGTKLTSEQLKLMLQTTNLKSP